MNEPKEFRFRSGATLQEFLWLAAVLAVFLIAATVSYGAGRALRDAGDWGVWGLGVITGWSSPAVTAALRKFLRAIPDERPGGDA